MDQPAGLPPLPTFHLLPFANASMAAKGKFQPLPAPNKYLEEVEIARTHAKLAKALKVVKERESGTSKTLDNR